MIIQRFLSIIAAVLLVLTATVAWGQTLPEDVLNHILAGGSKVEFEPPGIDVPLVGTPTLPLVEVSLNRGTTARFLIDLGSNVVIVRRDVFERAKGKILFDRKTKPIGEFASLEIGSAVFPNVAVGIYDELDVDGVIGYNLLRLCSFTIDYPRQRFLLHRGVLPPPAEDPKIIEYTIPDGMPLVAASLDGHTMMLNLDTGAKEWMTMPPALANELAWKSKPASGRNVWNNQTGATQVLEGRPRGNLTLGPLTIPAPLVYVNPDAEHAWVGSSLMQCGVWTFDPQHRYLRVETPTSPKNGGLYNLTFLDTTFLPNFFAR